MATPPGKVPIAESAAAGLKFLTDNWAKLLPACVIFGIAYGLYFYASALATAAASGSGLLLIAMLAVLTLTVITGASFYRLALRGEFPGVSGLSFGGDEARYLGVAAWTALPMLGIAFAAVFGMTPILAAAVKKSGYTLEQAASNPAIMETVIQNGGAMVLLIALAALILLMWLGLRLSLGIPATIAEKRIQLWSTASWTKGNVWRIFAAMVTLLAPLLILAAVVQSLFSLMLHINPSEAQAGTAPASPALAIYGFVYGVTSAFLTLAPSIGLTAFLYKGLRPPPQ